MRAAADPLEAYLMDDSSEVVSSLLKKGYVVIPSVLSPQECEEALDKIWLFLETVGNGGIDRDKPETWYPRPHRTWGKQEKSKEDPWPATYPKSFPDMVQNCGAGWLLGEVREKLAERVYEKHVFGTRELWSSKEGFTALRPQNENHNVYANVHVCGKPQKTSLGEHYDQSMASSYRGLCHIQASVALLDQAENDGCFVCWPGSHGKVHEAIVSDTYRGQESECWVPLTDVELSQLECEYGLKRKFIRVSKGDVILWRSDLVHAAGPAVKPTDNFRMVCYCGMMPVSAVAATKSVEEMELLREKKLEAYLYSRTGDHRADHECWHPDWGEREEATYSSLLTSAVTRVRLIKTYYQLQGGPPKLTWRQAELYGLASYNMYSKHEKKQEIERLERTGVRFESTYRDLEGRPHPSLEVLHHISGKDMLGQGTMYIFHSFLVAKCTLVCVARLNMLTYRHSSNVIACTDKWLGGMSSPCERYVYGVPGTHPRVLRITCATGEVDYIGPDFKGPFKWLRGIDVPSYVMGEDKFPAGCCIALPCNAQSILRIDPHTSEVTTFGNLDGTWMYHGGALASDGMIYAIPANAKQVLKIDPRTKETWLIGPEFEGGQKWYGGLLAANGAIYGIPQNASGCIKIVPETQEVCVVGEGLMPEGDWKWHGGLITLDGKIIYGFPNNADTVLKLDTTNDTLTLIGGPDILRSGRHRVPQDNKYKYLGGAITPDGKIFLFPCDAERVLMIDSKSDHVSCVGPYLLDGENKYQNGFYAKDGCCYAIPQRARGVLKISVAEEKVHVEQLDCGKNIAKYKEKFEGGVMCSGNIYCIPMRAKSVIKIIPVENRSQGSKV